MSRTAALAAAASRNALRALVIALGIAATLYVLFDLFFAPSYAIGDWLINYSHGFVRRGLAGQLILLLARTLHLPPALTAPLVQLPIYFFFLYAVYQLAKPLRRDVLWYCLIFSPASLPFMILNAGNAIRKEVLLFAALAAFILMLRRNSSVIALSLSLAAMFAVMVLSHDALFSCFVYFPAAVALSTRSLKRAITITAVPLLLAAWLINLVRHFPGSEAVARGICASIGGRWIPVDDTRDLCAGAIKHLSWTVQHSRQEELRSLHFWPLYIALAALSFAPFVVAIVTLRRRDGLRFEAKVIAWTALLGALASAPLFYLTIDWGRWIHMQIICLLLIILLAAQHAPGFQPHPDTEPQQTRRVSRTALRIAAFLYCTVWTLPVYAGLNLRFGYVDVPRFFRGENRLLRRIDGLHTIDRGW